MLQIQKLIFFFMHLTMVFEQQLMPGTVEDAKLSQYYCLQGDYSLVNKQNNMNIKTSSQP